MNKKKTWSYLVMLIRGQQCSDNKMRKQRMAENFSFLFILRCMYAIEWAMSVPLLEQKERPGRNQAITILFWQRVSLNAKRMNERSQISAILLIFLHCDHINWSHPHISSRRKQTIFSHPFSFIHILPFELIGWLLLVNKTTNVDSLRNS